jgi:hypothetical protein
MKPSRRRLFASGLVLGALLVPSVAVVWLVPKEPVYDGRRVSEWIDDLTGPVNPTYGSVGSQALPKLLQAVPGDEIVPSLGATLRRGLTIFDRYYISLYSRLPPRIAAKLARPDPARAAQLRCSCVWRCLARRTNGPFNAGLPLWLASIPTPANPTICSASQ